MLEDDLNFGYALNLTNNEGMQPASRELLAPAAQAAATPTVLCPSSRSYPTITLQLRI